MQQPFLDVKLFEPSDELPAATTLMRTLIVALAYVITGYAGLKLSFVGDAVTLFWPPTGIAFAALWLGGYRLLPGVIFGAFLVNLGVFGAPGPAALVALGNALPATVATIILRDMITRRENPGELWRVVRFILVAALASTTLSATVGTLAVSATGHGVGSLHSAWLVWWMGDAMGVMVVAPPILLWQRLRQSRFRWRSLFHASIFAAAGVGIVAGLLLIRQPLWAVELCKLFTLLLSLWAATRFGLFGPAAITLLMAVGAVTATMIGVGPFARASFYDSFALLHSYLFATAIAGMLLAAALEDLRRLASGERLARADADAVSNNRIRLLTMISHDVRTPLAGMMGVLQTLERTKVTAEQARIIDLGLRAGGTLTTLVSDILDVARADAGRISLVTRPFSPARSLCDIADLNRGVAANKLLKITVTGGARLPAAVLGDRSRFEQLLGNLVVNAIAYTASGRVIIAAAWDASSTRPLVVEVIDTGPGVDPDRVPEMFDAFRSETRPGNRSVGLGLGLHICRRLVEIMDGTIDYRAGITGGSVFRIALALPETAAAPDQLPSGSVETMRRILLVEDDVIAQQVTEALLKSHGHQVTVAPTADAAIALAAAHTFDVVLMDLQLDDATGEEDGSGLAAARCIRRLTGVAGRVMIIALTADARPEQRELCRAAGMDGLMVKPFGLAAGLDHAVQAAIGWETVAPDPEITHGQPYTLV